MDCLKTINPNLVNAQINKCFLEYDPGWVSNYRADQHVHGFKYYIERLAGLKLDFQPETKDGKYGYRLDAVEIVDEKKYTMFLLKYSS